jgi:uroporphyrinogen-III synthase
MTTKRIALPRPGDAEVARLVAEFRARGGAVTLCPPACVLPVRNGDGLAAAAVQGRPLPPGQA